MRIQAVVVSRALLARGQALTACPGLASRPLWALSPGRRYSDKSNESDDGDGFLPRMLNRWGGCNYPVMQIECACGRLCVALTPSPQLYSK